MCVYIYIYIYAYTHAYMCSVNVYAKLHGWMDG